MTFNPIWGVRLAAAATAGKTWQAAIKNINKALSMLASPVMPKPQKESAILTGIREATTDDPKFQKMMGTIQQGTPTLMGGYVAVSYASEKPSKKISGATVNGKPVPATTDDPGKLIKDLKFTSGQIEQKLMAIGKKYGWDSIEPGQGQGYSELFFDTSTEYTSETQRQLATNIVKTVNEINKFFNSMNSSLQATGLPGYKTSVWQGIGPDNNVNQIDNINQITNIAQGKNTKADPGSAIGRMILKYIPEYEAENDELGYDPQDFVNAKKVASIYIAKGERAGLAAQNKLDSHVSEMIDELLSDHGGSGLRTIWDLDEHVNQSMSEGIKQRLDAKCWKGKHKEGTKIKGGVRVNNCVPNESVAEGNGHEQYRVDMIDRDGQIQGIYHKDNTHYNLENMLSDIKGYQRNNPRHTFKFYINGKPVDWKELAANQNVTEGKKVDSFVAHVKSSEKKAGHSNKEAEDIAWATANKRGMLDNKNKKKVHETIEPISIKEILEGLDDDQKRVGQVGGKEKAKKIGTVLGTAPKKHPFNKRLVGE